MLKLDKKQKQTNNVWHKRGVQNKQMYVQKMKNIETEKFDSKWKKENKNNIEQLCKIILTQLACMRYRYI